MRMSRERLFYLADLIVKELGGVAGGCQGLVDTAAFRHVFGNPDHATAARVARAAHDHAP